nr:MAG TPA: hypothetical protein [Caudoviricetes sp.]
MIYFANAVEKCQKDQLFVSPSCLYSLTYVSIMVL